MSNLKTLEQNVASDATAREAFLKDPASLLQQHGLQLSAERATQLKSFINSQLQIPNSHVTGASLRTGGAHADGVEVTVSVGVKF
jgi:hypothetical protein